MDFFSTLAGRATTAIAVICITLFGWQLTNDSSQLTSTNETTAAADSQLAVSNASLDFGEVSVGESVSRTITVANAYKADQLTISNLFLDEHDSPHYSVNRQAPFTLKARQSVDIEVTFAPIRADVIPGRLVVNSNAGVEWIDFIGVGKNSDEPIMAAALPASFPFGKSLLAGFNNQKPTSLQFGPDGKLYVALINGTIKIFDIERTTSNDYKITGTETITQIKSITNHNDDGSVAANLNNRLVTGLYVTGTEVQPVIYVHSSDPRIGGGPTGATTNLDTNSGVLSRLTKSGNGWQKVDLVRGLPRSEENHHTNGITANASGTKLYIATGGNTNMGGISNNFALLPEYALSAAILEIDLLQIGNNTYDIPTLDDEDRAGVNDFNDPFGGNRGKNQAMLVSGGPVQVYAPGFRNPYDIVIMQNGNMYSWDNSPNSGWGGKPVNDGLQGNCTNGVSEPGQTQHDALHLISGAGYYAGHANPTRGNNNNTFNSSNPQSPVPYSNPVECQFRGAGTNGNGVHPLNEMLVTQGSSTNGIAEYKASNFGGQIQGDLLAASFNNKIYRVSFDGSGELQSKNVMFSNVGTLPLDVIAQGDFDVFPGTIWAADFQGNDIVVFEPEDYDGNGPSGCTGGNSSADSDLDGYTDADELANNTDPCSAADAPADADGDLISDLTDNDDDNDGINDVDDPFAVDGTNGAGTALGVNLQWENDGTNPGFIANLGFSGLMTNGSTNYREQFDLEQMTISGAAGVVTVDNVTSGDPINGLNNQEYAFQFGLNVNSSSPVFRAHTRILAPFSGFTPSTWQSMGMHIGTGDQDNYLKLAINSTGANGGIQFAREVNGSRDLNQNTSASIIGADYIDLYIEVDPSSAIAQALYQITSNGQSGAITPVGSAVTFPAVWLNNPTHLAVGIISTSVGAQPFPATWDFISVKSMNDDPQSNIAPSIALPTSITATTSTELTLTSTVTDDGLPFGSIDHNWTTLSGPATVNFGNASSSTTSAEFSVAGIYVLSLTSSDGELTSTETTTVTVEDQPIVNSGTIVYRINAGGPAVSNGNWLADNGSLVNTGNTWFSNVAVDISNIDPSVPAALFQTERYDPASGAGMLWTLPVTPGNYTVNLLFADTYFGTQAAGARVFNVQVEDQTLANFDIAASAGGYTAVVKSFDVTADNAIDISFEHVTQNPNIKAIEVVTAGNGGGVTPTNTPPFVNAGANGTVATDALLPLFGSIGDDGLPDGLLTATWTATNNAGSVEFTSTNTAATSVKFTAPGTYTLKLSANDGDLQSSDETIVVVSNPTTTVNSAPVVNAGSNQTTTVNSTISLAGVVSDDGLPNGSLTTAWTATNNAGSVVFTSTNTASTSVTFTAPGTYTLKLSANDGDLQNSDETTVVVNNPSTTTNTAPIVNAGANHSTTTASAISLTGVVSDDGLPSNTLTYSWTKVSGPGSVTFSNSSNSVTNATFTSAGTYLLQLQSSDGTLSSTDEVEVTVTATQASTIVYRINAGGPTLTDPGGNWQSDNSIGFFNTGKTYKKASPIDTSNVDAPEALFQSERYDLSGAPSLEWNLPVTPGNYEVHLYFAEIWSGAQGNAKRIFNINVEGNSLNNFDIFNESGSNTAISKVFTVASDDILNIAFDHVTENPAIKGIKVIQLP